MSHNSYCNQHVQDCRLYGVQTSVSKYQMIHKHFHNNHDLNFCKVSDIQQTLFYSHCKQYKQTTELPITFFLKESHLFHNF